MEKVQYVSDSHADVRAAEKMGKLFDELLEANPNLADGKAGVHSLNVFFTRLLFCFFCGRYRRLCTGRVYDCNWFADSGRWQRYA
nr:hypothetical protein [Corynebacterium diphtheriae]